ncbi:MAG: helix-turn-helix domain-containing protein [Deltaproteobacteria bacterium]|nr:helix-turn-helix domain-containing protein [Deltaproteobacteria bacterium]
MIRKGEWRYTKAQLEKGACKKDIARELGVHPKTISRVLRLNESL